MSPVSTSLANIPAAVWPWVVARLHREGKGRPVVVVCPTGVGPETVAEGLEALGVAAVVLPAWDVQPYDRESASPLVQGLRLSALQALRDSKKPPVVVTTLPALGVRVVPEIPEALDIRVGQALNPEHVMKQLAVLGYKREDVVQEAGTFARRGGVMDVWPAAMEEPIRLEWFDVEVEHIRAFDPGTQRAVGAIDEVVIGPAAEVVLTAERVEAFRQQYREMCAQLGADGTDDEVYRFVTDGLRHPTFGQLLPLFFDEPLPAVAEVLPKNTLLVVGDELEALAGLWGETVEESYRSRAGIAMTDGVGLRAVPPERLFVWGDDLTEGLARFEVVELHRFEEASAEHTGLRGHSWLMGNAQNAGGNRHGAVVLAAKEIAARAREGWQVVVSASSPSGLAHLLRGLEAEGAPGAQPAETFAQALGRKGKGAAGVAVQAVVSAFAHGWVDPQARLLVVGEADVFGDKIGQGPVRKRKKRSPEEMIAHFSELRDGDYVVHELHGIGKFSGLITMEINGGRQDFLKILYAGDDRLFVPVESLDVLSRYKGAEAGVVVLDKLGTGGWEARKEKVRQDLLEMADELIATAAARELVERTPPLEEHIRNDGLYDDFCGGFPYALTDDQASVMEDVEADLSAGHPMDRLVVGDVGFGKTEVALRAAFLVAASGRQVAIVCPTTLLARQHMDVFAQRFAGFPMKVAGLSRLVGAAQAKLVKAGLTDGSVDIVVGTHALLSKDIKFKNLGLVVIDEEQRFGVAHKERLKQLKDGTDVLTLTATPIPRTLQMAVGGVRGLSLITTPPVDRLAVQTHVLAWDNKTIKEAIQRELQRGGQVYVVAPHIEDLPRLQDDLANLVPDARVGVAHGQLGEGQLEAVMTGFYAGELNVLLATTIIESGIDVPKANTLIVYHADRFGLAQLYQLRGRVGRSRARAFAYFLLPEGPLGNDAARRLQILQRLDGLGAGFTLASYDMDMRGFGNLLGKQQSGHIRDIGFELYAKMLKDAVEERQRRNARRDARRAGEVYVEPEQPLERGQVSLKLGVTYLIPDDYVPDVATRLQLYRRLAQVADEAGLAEFKDELVDRFGPMPAEVVCLLQVMSLRNRAAALNVQRVEVGEKGVVIGFAGGRFANPEGLIRFIGSHAGVVTVRPDQSLIWHRRLGEGGQRLGGVAVILGELEMLVV